MRPTARFDGIRTANGPIDATSSPIDPERENTIPVLCYPHDLSALVVSRLFSSLPSLFSLLLFRLPSSDLLLRRSSNSGLKTDTDKKKIEEVEIRARA